MGQGSVEGKRDIDRSGRNNLECYYRTGTSIRQAPVFRHLRAYEKAHGSLLSRWINYNYTACCWFPTSSNILKLPSQFWHIRFESCWLHFSKCRILVFLRYFVYLFVAFSMANKLCAVMLLWCGYTFTYKPVLYKSHVRYNFHEIEWGVAISCQLGLLGPTSRLRICSAWLLRGCKNCLAWIIRNVKVWPRHKAIYAVKLCNIKVAMPEWVKPWI